MLRACAFAAAGLAGCTPGAQVAPNSHAAAASAILIGMSLVRYGAESTPFGTVQAYNPAFVTVPLGSTIQFHNDDGFNHTATMIGGSFPSSNTFQLSALNASGTTLAAAGWSTGDLLPNGFSQTLSASSPGTYRYGCYHHYPVMRGVIIVQ
jgi:plastocyanin